MSLTTVQLAFQRSARYLARAVGLAPTSWAVSTPAAGLGGTPTSAGTWAGRVLQEGKANSMGLATPGTPVSVRKWYAVASGSDTLAPHQQISAGGYTFTVVGEPHAGLGVYEVTQV